MAHHEEHIPATPEEAIFYDCLKNGDDFMKIEIYRLARFWYRKALETGIRTEMISEKLAGLEEKSRFERKVIAILGIIAAIIIAGVWVMNS